VYSDIAEGPGHLEGANGGQSQTKWLTATLAQVKRERRTRKRRALIIVWSSGAGQMSITAIH